MPGKQQRNHRKNSRAPLSVLVVLLLLFLSGGIAQYFGWIDFAAYLPNRESATEPATEPITEPAVTGTSKLEIHFIPLGYNAGDCIYIKAGETDLLIDAGAKYSDVEIIDEYLKRYVTDATLEYVIVTHAHKDHYAGFAGSATYPSLFTRYECDTIIDFAMATESSMGTEIYSRYEASLAAEVSEGARHMTAAECRQSGNYTFTLSEGITLTVLDSYYYYNLSSDENNHSVSCLVTEGTRNYLFTGDLEKEGEEYLTKLNDLPEVVLYKAGHHGSVTSSSDALLSCIRPEIVCVCCCAGAPEYTKTDANMFPTQAFIDRVAPYTDRVYVTTLYDPEAEGKYVLQNGEITLTATPGVAEVSVTFSGVDTKLCDTEWFREHRVCPDAWKKE